jgi:pyruvate dehydrogenase E2 component (dihydrolipoamide acetyltransferase)
MADLTTTDVRVPDIGDFADVPVIEILVAEGDEVSAEDPLIVLESEKATMEVPSPTGGTVAEIAVGVGDGVSEGDLILTLTVSNGGASPEDAGDSADGGEEGEPAVPSSAEGVDGSSEGPEKARDGAGADRGRAEAGDREGDEAPRDAPADETPREAEAGEEEQATAYAGPAARKLARELGVALAGVEGTGRKGRITTDDVRAAAEGAPAEEQAAPRPEAAGGPSGWPELPAWPEVDFASYGDIEAVDLSRIKRIAGPALARNWALIPHVTQCDEADITELEAFRKELNAEQGEEGVKVTMVSLMLKASAAVLRAHPNLNASLAGDQLVLKRHFHIGFAVDTPGGLLVPVIRDVDRKGLLNIARELSELSGAAREGALSAEQMRGGTFTISSLGGIGGTWFTPIINAPEVAILGVSRARMQPVWDGAGFRPRLMVPLSLSYDHRVIDGAEAVRFTTHLAHLLADPRRMLL